MKRNEIVLTKNLDNKSGLSKVSTEVNRTYEMD